jgi:hypothetical protein
MEKCVAYLTGRFMKLMYIEFLDHCSEAGLEWKSVEDLSSEVPTISVAGFLAKEDDKAYHLVQAHGDGQYSNCFSILKSTIVRKKYFKI